MYLGTILAFILIGNGSVLAAIFFSKSRNKVRMTYFIMHLAVAGKYLQDHFQY